MEKKANDAAMANRSSSVAQYPGTITKTLVVEVPAIHAVRLPPPTTPTATSILAELQSQHHRLGVVALAETRRQPAPAQAPGATVTIPVGAGSGSPKFIARTGSGGRRHVQQTSTGSRVACPNIVELSPPGLDVKSINVEGGVCSPTSSRPARIRPSTSPRKLASGGGGGNGSRGGGRGRRGDTIAPELVMATVSLCLGGDDDCEAAVAATPEDHRRFTVDMGRLSHYKNQASPASLLAEQADAAASPTVGTSPGRKILVSGTGAVDDGGDYEGRGDNCTRPAEATAGVDETTVRSHGFRRWRPGESEADALPGEQGQRLHVFS